MHTRDTFNIPQHYITHITVKETHFSALHPATVQNGSTRLRNLTIFHWLWGDCDIEVDCETRYCITRQCGLKGRLMAGECLFWFDFFSKAFFDRFLSLISHFLCMYDLTVIARLIVHSGKLLKFTHVNNFTWSQIYQSKQVKFSCRGIAAR